MRSSEARLRRLCEAVSVGESDINFDAVLASLNIRQEEYQRFSNRKQAYLDICNKLPTPRCFNGTLFYCFLFT